MLFTLDSLNKLNWVNNNLKLYLKELFVQEYTLLRKKSMFKEVFNEKQLL